MAGEIQHDHHTSGLTLYAMIRTTTGTIWNTAGVAFEAYATGNITDYDIALAEQGTASRYYVGTFPATIAAGVYNLIVKQRAGGAPAESDDTVGEGAIEWDGSAVVSLSSIRSRLPAPAPGSSGGMLIAGSNAATTFDAFTVTNALTVNGAVIFNNTMQIYEGLDITVTAGNNPALNLRGFGAGPGLYCQGGASANGAFFYSTAANLSAVLMHGGGTGSSHALELMGDNGAGLSATSVTVDGTTTFTGAVTAANVSNNIVGIDVTKAAGTAWGSGAITAASLAADAGTEIADAILSRSVATVEGSMPEYCLGSVVLGCLNWSIVAGVWTVHETDGITVHLTRTLTTDAAAELVTGVA